MNIISKFVLSQINLRASILGQKTFLTHLTHFVFGKEEYKFDRLHYTFWTSEKTFMVLTTEYVQRSTVAHRTGK